MSLIALIVLLSPRFNHFFAVPPDQNKDDAAAVSSEVIAANLTSVNRRIQLAAENAGRDPGEINLLAVSKTKPLEAVVAAFEAGQLHFGENYLQDALSKIEAGPISAVWHFIGAIQSNKTRAIAENFSWVHTVSSLKIARRLNEQRPEHLGSLKIFLQVNIDDDENKAGLTPSQLPELLGQIAEYEKLDLQGLMTIPRKADQLAAQRRPFAALRALQSTQLPEAKALSMGMSGDLEAAIMEGATWVRVGTDIFGQR